MNIEYLDAPEGIEATWYIAHGTLYIALAPDLDEVTRQRYIETAKAEHGIIEERRRRLLVPLLPSFGRHAAGHGKSATAIAVGGGMVAAGVAAAVVIPTALNQHHEQGVRPPAAGAPAPTRSRSSTPPPGRRPAPSESNPSTPGALQPTLTGPSTTPLVPRHPIRSLVGPHPVRSLVGGHPPVSSHPLAPVRNVVNPPPHPLADLQLPRAGVRVDVSPSLSIRVRLGRRQP